jgi:heme ABC exporter ATP-binding subunit CcmA
LLCTGRCCDPDSIAPTIHLDGVVCLLGRFPALAGVDLQVEAGEVVALRGPNGAGKTTVLRLCAGLLPVAQGVGRVLGHDLTVDAREIRRRVGLVGHHTALYDDLTVAENVRFWGTAAGAAEADCMSALSRLGLDGRLAELPASRLSAGQRRRASIAAMVARRPELWLLDEPHAGLDEAGRDLIDVLIAEAAGRGATVLFASHEHDRVARIDPRVVEVDGGMIHEVPRSSVHVDREPGPGPEASDVA